MKTVIKLAGALLEDDATVRALARQIADSRSKAKKFSWSTAADAFSPHLKRMGIDSKFVAGLRVTNRGNPRCRRNGFAGLLNKRLASAISAEGAAAIGISAADNACFPPEPMIHNEVEGSLGFVGYLTGLNNSLSNPSGAKAWFPSLPVRLGPDNELLQH